MADVMPSGAWASVPDPVPRTPLVCLGRSTGAVCEGRLMVWGVHSAWRSETHLFVAVLAQNRTTDLRRMASRGVTLLDQRGLQFGGTGDCPSSWRPSYWDLDAQIYPGAMARVWVVVPWEADAVPHTLIWEAGQALSSVAWGDLPLTASRGGERLMASWTDLVQGEGSHH